MYTLTTRTSVIEGTPAVWVLDGKDGSWWDRAIARNIFPGASWL